MQSNKSLIWNQQERQEQSNNDIPMNPKEQL